MPSLLLADEDPPNLIRSLSESSKGRYALKFQDAGFDIMIKDLSKGLVRSMVNPGEPQSECPPKLNSSVEVNTLEKQGSTSSSNLQSCLESKDQNKKCIVCLQPHKASAGLFCSNGHFICDEDLSEWACCLAEDSDSAMSKRSARVLCPGVQPDASRCPAQPFAEVDLLTHVHRAAFEAHLAALLRHARAAGHDAARMDADRELEELAHDLRAAGVPVDLSDNLLARQLRRMLPNPLQCGQCGFGPVDPFSCSDLNAHHLEPVSTTPDSQAVHINNACPACGWFSPNVFC